MSDITRHGIAVFRIRRNSSNDVVVTVQGSWLDDWDQLEGDPITREKTYPNPHQAARDMPWFGAESTAQKTTQETAQRKIAASSKGKHTYVSRWEERGENDRKISIPEARESVIKLLLQSQPLPIIVKTQESRMTLTKELGEWQLVRHPSSRR